MNENDSEKIAGMLESIGYAPTDSAEDADIILLNTCCVRRNAEDKVYGLIGQLKRLKERNPDLILAVCGCMIQQEAELAVIQNDYPYVDLVFGTHNLHRLPELLDQVQSGKRRVIEVWDSEGEIVEGLPAKRQTGFQAWITVMYGCNNFCSYCIVPYVRGRERSRSRENILEEVRSLVAVGFSEFTLLGQNVNSYGRDLGGEYDFASLMRDVSPIAGVKRVRFTTSHPKDMSQRLIDVIAEEDTICEHVHLPLQAGSNRILARMNRSYTREDYLRLIDLIRAKIPQAAITTDLIVGFPGETRSDFEDTLDMVRRVRFDSAFTFAFSPRIGTPAAGMDDQVDHRERMDRLYELIETQNAISKERNSEMVGHVFELLVEGKSGKDSTRYQGRTRTNKIVTFDPEGDLDIGSSVWVRITRAKTWTLEGERLSDD
jgi:tRNA-2-methylthio-N6-dimethylallyladenosine synthase